MKAYLGLVALAFGILPTPAAFAQGCASGACGPRLGGVTGCAHGRSDCGWCGLKQNPLMEKRYIKQFCRPTISPDSCFGYFRTNWTQWNQACPNWPQDVEHPGPYMFQRTAATAPSNPTDTPTPKETPKAPAATDPKTPAPMDPKTTPLPSPKEMKPMTVPMPDPLPKPPVLPTNPEALPKPPALPTIPNPAPLPKPPTGTPKSTDPAKSKSDGDVQIPPIPTEGTGPSTSRSPF